MNSSIETEKSEDRRSKLVEAVNGWSLLLMALCLATMMALLMATGSAGLGLSAKASALSAWSLSARPDSSSERTRVFVAWFFVAFSVAFQIIYFTVIVHRRPITPAVLWLNAVAGVLWIMGIIAFGLALRENRPQASSS